MDVRYGADELGEDPLDLFDRERTIVEQVVIEFVAFSLSAILPY